MMKTITNKRNGTFRNYNYYNPVKAENSELFKILDMSYLLELENLPVFTFIRDKKDNFINEAIKNCRIRFEEYEFERTQGILMKIYDDYRKEVITSRNPKVEFLGRKGFNWEEHIWNAKDPHSIISNIYGFDDTLIQNLSCEFKTSIPSKQMLFQIQCNLDGYNALKFFALGIGQNSGYAFNRDNAQKDDFKETFELKYREYWQKEINLVKSPYFDCF